MRALRWGGRGGLRDGHGPTLALVLRAPGGMGTEARGTLPGLRGGCSGGDGGRIGGAGQQLVPDVVLPLLLRLRLHLP
jgi:hypothetical protein